MFYREEKSLQKSQPGKEKLKEMHEHKVIQREKDRQRERKGRV